MKMRIVLFSGSLRRDSHQSCLLRHMAERINSGNNSANFELDIFPPAEVDLPLFNQDLEMEPEIRSRVLKVYDRFAAADGFIVASPEYNAQVSPFLKNTFDWVSRLPRIAPPTPSAFKGKPLLLSSVSTGWTGGIQGLAAARLLFNYMGFLVVPGQICVSYAEDWRDGNDFAFEETFSEHIDRVLKDFEAQMLSQKIISNAYLRQPVEGEAS